MHACHFVVSWRARAHPWVPPGQPLPRRVARAPASPWMSSPLGPGVTRPRAVPTSAASPTRPASLPPAPPPPGSPEAMAALDANAMARRMLSFSLEAVGQSACPAACAPLGAAAGNAVRTARAFALPWRGLGARGRRLRARAARRQLLRALRHALDAPRSLGAPQERSRHADLTVRALQAAARCTARLRRLARRSRSWARVTRSSSASAAAQRAARPPCATASCISCRSAAWRSSRRHVLRRARWTRAVQRARGGACGCAAAAAGWAPWGGRCPPVRDAACTRRAQDSFYRGLTPEEQANVSEYNFDHPNAMDQEAIMQARCDSSLLMPVTSCARLGC
jgi:hypothetical protein